MGELGQPACVYGSIPFGQWGIVAGNGRWFVVTDLELTEFLWVPWVPSPPLEGEEELNKLDSWAGEEPTPIYCL